MVAADGRKKGSDPFLDPFLPESSDTLAQIARLLELRPDLKLYVDGPTDNEGADEYSQDLSTRRAAAVVAAMVSQYGIDGQRLEARGFGES